MHDIGIDYNNKVQSELWLKYNIYRNLDREDYFAKTFFAVKDYPITWEDIQWNALTLLA